MSLGYGSHVGVEKQSRPVKKGCSFPRGVGGWDRAGGGGRSDTLSASPGPTGAQDLEVRTQEGIGDTEVVNAWLRPADDPNECAPRAQTNSSPFTRFLQMFPAACTTHNDDVFCAIRCHGL